MILFSNSFSEWDFFSPSSSCYMLFGISKDYLDKRKELCEYLFDNSSYGSDFAVISLDHFMDKFLDSVAYMSEDSLNGETIVKEMCSLFRKLHARQPALNIEYAKNFRYGLGVDLYPFIGDC